ncbi:MAG TPA: molybdopterin-dependent oxidoreductase [Ilumatobacteraceae bacterium]|nr:molybdopterin-dependent oxidoreductase [Ilumatobacteraceae bacterium]
MDERSYGPRWMGPLLGLVATGAGLAAAELVVGLFERTSSPVVPVGQVFIDWVPKPLKDWAIETFGTNDKVVLVIGALVVLVGIGVGAGVLAMRGARAAAVTLTCVTGVIGAWAVLTRPEPTLVKLLPTIVGTGVSVGVLLYLAPRPASAATGSDLDQAAQPMGVDRRRFVGGAIGIGSVAVIAGGVGRLLQQRFEVSTERSAISLPRVDAPAPVLPADVQLPLDGLGPFVTPNADFYRIDTALVVPQVSKDSWRLKIGGMVDNPMELTFDDLLARPQVERYVTLSCVSNPIGGDLIGNALWQGVLLRDVLEEAGVQPEATQIVSRSIDDWTAGTPTEIVMDGRDALLAIAMNGEPLPARHGYPVRMVVPGLYGYVSATKWVTEIEMTRWEDYDAYWVPRGWSKRGPIKTMSRVDTDRRGATPSDVIVGGVAWAIHRGVSRVEVRSDGGEWFEADLGGVPSSDTWVQWMATLDLEPGRHMVESRAFDGDGVPQTEETAPVAPNGAQGYPRRWIDV